MSESSGLDRRRSRLLLATLAPSFYLAEWLLVAFSASAFAWLTYHGLSTAQIWLLFWIGNLAVSTGFLACNDRLLVDITLMQALRKWTEITAGRNPGFGRALEAAVCVRLLLWEGPCQLVIYLRRRLPSPAWQLPLLVVSSGIQMLVWTQVFALGCNGIGDLLRHFQGGHP